MSGSQAEFPEYVRQRLSADLAALVQADAERYAKGGYGPAECPHHGVPADRVVALPEGRSSLPAAFWGAWYVTTLLHQAVHRYASRAEPDWLASFGRHPLPMERHGVGCWRPAPPRTVLRGAEGLAAIWPEVCEYVVGTGLPAMRAVGVEIRTLVPKILADAEFDRDDPMEGELWRLLEGAVRSGS